MRIRPWSLLALALLALTQPSCATMGLTPLQDSMPSARAGLLPEYRLFYDALVDDGDWTLIEPFGYVFRPYGNVAGWRPYQYGYWAPSDVYGWVWISSEPYGWATYHYGEWFFDRYQGWVWIPGLDWGPAWVAWEETPDYIGWAPMSPAGYGTEPVPGGAFVYVAAAELAATDLQTRARTKDQIGEQLGIPRPLENAVERDGVRFNAGPKFDVIERRAGPLQRVEIEALLPGVGPAARARARPDRPTPATKPATRSAPDGTGAEIATVEAMRRAAEESARAARSVTERHAAPPPIVGLLRRAAKPESASRQNPGEAAPPGHPRTSGHAPAAADSTKQR
jgi:hypothetical protein